MITRINRQDELNPNPLRRKLIRAKVNNKKRHRIYRNIKQKFAISTKLPSCLTLILITFKYSVLTSYYNLNFSFNLKL